MEWRQPLKNFDKVLCEPIPRGLVQRDVPGLLNIVTTCLVSHANRVFGCSLVDILNYCEEHTLHTMFDMFFGLQHL